MVELHHLKIHFYPHDSTVTVELLCKKEKKSPSCKVVYLLYIANNRCPYQPSKEDLDIALILGGAVNNQQVIDILWA